MCLTWHCNQLRNVYPLCATESPSWLLNSDQIFFIMIQSIAQSQSLFFCPCTKPFFEFHATLPLFIAVILQSCITLKHFWSIDAWIIASFISQYLTWGAIDPPLKFWNQTCLCMTTISHSFDRSHTCAPNANHFSMIKTGFAFTRNT